MARSRLRSTFQEMPSGPAAWLVAASMPAGIRTGLVRSLLTGLSPDAALAVAEAVYVPPEALEELSCHEDAQVRAAAAAAPAVSPTALARLRFDADEQVRAAAELAQTVRDLDGVARAGAALPYDTESSARVVRLLRSSWGMTLDTAHAVEVLLTDARWRRDEEFLAACLASFPETTPRALGTHAGWPEAFGILASLAAGPRRWDFVGDFLAAMPDLPAQVEVVHANAATVAQFLVEYLGEDWRTVPRHPPRSEEEEHAFRLRVAMPSVPAQALREEVAASADDSALLACLAGSADREFRCWLVSHLASRLHLAGDLRLYWPLVAALTDEDVMGLPFAALAGVSPMVVAADEDDCSPADESARRAMELFASRLAVVVEDRPEAWETFAALADGFTGTFAELLAACADL